MRQMLVLGAAAIALVALPAALQLPTRLVWNASPSVPVGLYAVHPLDAPALGDLALVDPPDDIDALLSERGYLAAGLPILKRVAALPGQHVCRDGLVIRIDGETVAKARSTDSLDRPMPAWSGCRLLGPNEVFLLNADAPDSFDGRYVGPLPRATLSGRAVPLWTEGGT
ncbi:S26 family signal peptidase [Aestuariibius insulae]|uniref:S26 family signal peptidase n=1 Tax=Aestuariibius insulae TaxID=2058287 RepID=UPI00345EF860